MSPERKRALAWALVIGALYLVYWLLARYLAARDPIGEAIQGGATLVLPLSGIVLLLRVALVVAVPPLVARALVRKILP